MKRTSLIRKNLINYNCKKLFLVISFLFLFIIYKANIFHDYKYSKKILNDKSNKLIKENFFVFDSNNLENVYSHMFGYSISKKGIITDNYYKQIGKYIKPGPHGLYIMIRKIRNKIIINQDFYGGFGLYLYENKLTDYFALSNSFLLLEEYLVDKQYISFNKDFADHLITSNLCSYSVYETMINEIVQIPSNSFITINIIEKKIYIFNIDYKENTIPLESEEGLKLINKWMDKWGYILRSLKKKTNNISYDLSGGFDTRTLLTILLNSGINLNEILIHTFQNNEHGHDEDLKIASNISSKYGFELNKLNISQNYKKWGIKNTLFCTLYSKLGFHKEFYFKNEFHIIPKFEFTGAGGEFLRGYPGAQIKRFIESLSYQNITGHTEEFHNSSIRFLIRNIELLKKKKKFNNDYEIASFISKIGLSKYHFGKSALESYIANIYTIQPLMDPELKKIKYNISGANAHDLIAYIYIHFAHDLIHFPIQGNRYLNKESILKALKLNDSLAPYKIKSNFNKNFYIDTKRTTSFETQNEKIKPNEFLKNFFDSKKFSLLINKVYDDNVIHWAKKYSKKRKFFPLRHEYALLAISKTIEFLLLNKKYMNKIGKRYNLKKKFLNSYRI